MTVAMKQRKTMPDSPEAVYRAAVLAAADGDGASAPNPAILEDAVRLLGDFHADLRSYRRRLQLTRELRETVPALELAAAEAERIAAAATRLADRPAADFKTIGEIAVAVQKILSEARPGFVSAEKCAAHEAKMLVRSTRSEVSQQLRASSDPQLETRIGELRREIGNVQSRIADRRELAGLESRIVEQTNLAKQLAEGRGLSQFQSRGDGRSATVLYRETKQRVRELVALRPAAEKARKETAVDEKRIGELTAKIADLEQQKLQPGNMAWSQ